MKILMCAPEHYQVVYKINPWMTPEKPADQSRAYQQWDALRETLTACGAEVVLVPPQPNVPDMVFTANAGLVMGNQAFLSHFYHQERRPEREHFKRWFIDAGFTIHCDDAANYQQDNGVSQYHGTFFEGAGDALYTKDTLFAGYGFRSDKSIYEQIGEHIQQEVVLCELVDPRFYHIDTCFCPLNDEHALWWPGAFSEASQRMMQERITCHAVPEHEAAHFACNSVVIGQQVVTPAECEQTAGILKDLGLQARACDMSQYLKAGGACKCLTLTVG